MPKPDTFSCNNWKRRHSLCKDNAGKYCVISRNAEYAHVPWEKYHVKHTDNAHAVQAKHSALRPGATTATRELSLQYYYCCHSARKPCQGQDRTNRMAKDVDTESSRASCYTHLLENFVIRDLSGLLVVYRHHGLIHAVRLVARRVLHRTAVSCRRQKPHTRSRGRGGKGGRSDRHVTKQKLCAFSNTPPNARRIYRH